MIEFLQFNHSASICNHQVDRPKKRNGTKWLNMSCEEVLQDYRRNSCIAIILGQDMNMPIGGEDREV